MQFHEWPEIEIEGYDKGSVVAVPVLARVAAMVDSAAALRGVKRGVFLAGVIGAGLAIVAAGVPVTPPSEDPESYQ